MIRGRLVAYLLEHYDGAFPTWLAPVQALVVPVSDAFRDYAQRIAAGLRAKLVRAAAAPAAETVARNVRDAVAQRIPNVLVVGQREQADQTVTLRRLGVAEQLVLPVDELERRLLATISRRLRTFLVP